MTPQQYLKHNNVQVLAFSGRAKSGKDYLAERTAIPWGFLPTALANDFKVEAVAKDGLSIAAAFWAAKTPAERDMLQKRGTEEGRDVFGVDLWVNHWMAWMCYYTSKGFTNFVVTDVRFPNEVEAVKALGGKVYRVTGRGGLTDGTKLHVSETALNDYEGFDRIFDNSVENENWVITQVIDALHEDFGHLDYGRHLQTAFPHGRR